MILINHSGLPCNWLTGIVEFPHCSATFIVKATYDLAVEGVARRSAEQPPPSGDLPWPPLPDAVGEPSLRYAGDFAPFKPCADVLLAGCAHAPAGAATPALLVTLGVGAWRKQVAVIGDRHWTGWRHSEPVPFTSLPLRWELAFGGADFPENPLGRGHRGDLLPNLERSGDLITGRGSRPLPSCFAPTGITWEARSAKLGTYRRDYIAKRWPAFAEDFDWGYFNSAPLDQQVPGYLRGDEPLLLEHLHPQHPRVACRLPGQRPRLFVAPLAGGAVEVPLVCDTLWIDAEALQAVLVWRGLHRVADPELSDLASAYLVDEPLERAAPAGQHLAEFARLRAAAALPPPTRDDGADRAALEAALARPLAKPPVSRAWTAATVRARLGAAGSLAGEDLRGLDLSGLRAPTAALAGALLAGAVLRGADLAGADLSGADLTGADLMGADLSGADLLGADLSGAHLAEVRLDGARLASALFAGADLRAARLTGVNAKQADFARAGLAGADLNGALLDGALLTGACLDGALLIEASLVGAALAGASAKGADFEGADLSKVKASPGADLSGAKLRRVVGGDGSWSRCTLDGCDLTFSQLNAAQFAGASLKGASFLGAALKRALFDGADLTAAVFDHANLCGASLARSDLTRASFRTANCFQAGFTAAERAGADFTGADTTGSDLAAGGWRA